MKPSYLYTALLMALVGGAVLTIPRLLGADPDPVSTVVQKADPRFGGTEAAIATARRTKNTTALLGINALLQPIDSPESRYWQAYSLFQVAILRNNAHDKDHARQYVDRAIRVLDQLPVKDSEDYALMALMRAFSIRFVSFFNVSGVAQQAKTDGLKAIETDSTNLRAFLVAGLNDFYTPVMFGGQKEAEALFRRAVALGDQPGALHSNVHWGQDQAFEYLCTFYNQRGQRLQAEAVRQRAALRFPANAAFKRLSAPAPQPLTPPLQ